MKKKIYLLSSILLIFVVSFSAAMSGRTQSILAAEPSAIEATDPQIILNSANSVTPWLSAGGFVYLIDNCAIPTSPIATLKRRPTNGSIVTTMQSINNANLCNTYLSAAADESGIYWYNRDLERIEHIPTDDPQSIPQVVATIGDWARIGFGDGISVLNLTSSSIYWIQQELGGEFSPDTISIMRVSKAGGTPTVITTYTSLDGKGVRHEGLGISGNHLLWADYGGIYRYPINCFFISCAPVKVVNQSILEGRVASGNGSELLWWDQDATPNRLNRITCGFSTCTSSFLANGANGAKTFYAAASASELYWLENISPVGMRLQRKPRSGGTAETLDETIGNNLPFVDASHVYYSPAFNQIGRLPHDAEAITREFSILGWEVTQGIQNLDNEVPLIAGKTTYVRLYPKLENGDSVNSLTAELRGSRNGDALPGSPLFPINGNLTVDSSLGVENRANLDNGWLFRLPESWVSEDDLSIPQMNTTIDLVAEIDPNGVYAATDSDINNDLAEDFTFIAKAPTCMSMRPVWTHEGTPFLYSYQVAHTARIAESMLPTANLIPIIKSDRLEEIDWCWKGPIYGPFCSDPYELTDDTGGLLTKMGWIDFWEDNPAVCTLNNARTLTAGIVHPDSVWTADIGTSTGNTSGMARTGKDQFLAKVPSASIGAFDSTVGRARTMPHEIGHNYNRRHIDCPVGTPKRPDMNYPYVTSTIDDGLFSDTDTHFGFDTLTQQPIAPNIPGSNSGDLMSYCGRWTSDYTWKAILNGTQGPIFVPFRDFENLADFLLIGGYVNETDGTGELDYGWTYPADSASTGLRQNWADALAQAWDRRAPNATYHVRLIGKNDQIISDHTIELSSVDDDHHHEISSFQFSVPAPVDAVVIMQLMADDVVLDSIGMGEKAPVVTLIKPAGGETVGDSLTVEWEASDPDNDQLQFTIQYSYDDGAHWTPLLVNYAGSGEGRTEMLSLAIGAEPGSAGQEAMIRIVASDGVNTTIATSNAFSVAPRSPRVVITNLADDEIFSPSDPLRLDGFVYDPEDLLLQKQNLIWTTGQFSVTGRVNDLAGLAPGQHTISLKGIDSDGLTTEFSRTVEIAPFHINQTADPLVLDGSCDDVGYQDSTHLPFTENADGSRPQSWLIHDASRMWICTGGIDLATDVSKVYLDLDPTPSAAIRSSSVVFTVNRDGSYTMEEGNENGTWSEVGPKDVSVRIQESAGAWSVELRINQAVFGDWQRRVHFYLAQTDGNPDSAVKWPLGGDQTNPQSWGATNLGLVSQLSGILPFSTTVSTADLELMVEGQGFTADNIVLLDGVELDTGFIAGGVISATIPAGLIQTSGSYSITVGIDGVDGLKTTHQVLQVTNPAPTISGLTPDKVENGQSSLSVTISGSNFLADSQVMWGGEFIESTFVSSGELQVSLTANQLAIARIVGVVVLNRDPGGGSSDLKEFEITSPFDPVNNGSSAIYLPLIVR